MDKTDKLAQLDTVQPHCFRPAIIYVRRCILLDTVQCDLCFWWLILRRICSGKHCPWEVQRFFQGGLPSVLGGFRVCSALESAFLCLRLCCTLCSCRRVCFSLFYILALCAVLLQHNRVTFMPLALTASLDFLLLAGLSLGSIIPRFTLSSPYPLTSSLL